MPSILGDSLVDDGGIDSTISYDTGQGLSVKDFTLKYSIRADDLSQREDDILATIGLPEIMTYLRGAYCVRKAAVERNAAALLWEVSCDFSSDVSQAEDPEEPPDQRVARVSWTTEELDEVIEYDAITGKNIVNAAEQQIIATGKTLIPVLQIRRWERYPFNPNLFLNYANHVNTNPFLGAPAGSALLKPMEAAEPQNMNGILYTDVTYRIAFRIRNIIFEGLEFTAFGVPVVFQPVIGANIPPDAWKMRLLNEGTKERDAAGQPLKAAEDEKGNKITVRLDKDAVRLPDNAPAVWLDYHRYPQANFDDLNLLGQRFPS